MATRPISTPAPTSTDAVPFRIDARYDRGKGLRVEARYDPANVIGALCIYAEAEDGEQHSSCWEVEGVGAPLRVVTLRIARAGTYLLQMRQVSGNGSRASNVLQILVN